MQSGLMLTMVFVALMGSAKAGSSGNQESYEVGYPGAGYRGGHYVNRRTHNQYYRHYHNRYYQYRGHYGYRG